MQSKAYRVGGAELGTVHISEHSRALALKLSSHMGIENAIKVSTENQWHGVVAALEAMRDVKVRIK